MPKLTEIDGKTPEFMKAIGTFVFNPKGFLLIAGSNGNGKTFAAKAIYDYFWHPHSDNKFWNQADLKIKWQDTIAGAKTLSFILHDIVQAPLLVLDDIGTSRPTEAFMEFLYIISDKRNDLKDTHGTIITTNLNSQSMRDMFGDAFVSRVASGICVRNDLPDRRPNLF